MPLEHDLVGALTDSTSTCNNLYEESDQFLLELMQRVSETPSQEEPTLTLFPRDTERFQSCFVFLRDQLQLKFRSVTFGVAVFVFICVTFFSYKPTQSQKRQTFH